MNKINKFLYVGTFILLYLGVALVSTLHAFDFFKLTNTSWIAAILAGSFEVGQAAVLFSILTTKAERGKVMPWILMFILTAVQIIGNVYACYKYVVLNSMDMLQYFREPIFVWTKLPDEQSTVILTYIAASILPIVALAMTAMITSFLNDNSDNEPVKIDNEHTEKDTVHVENAPKSPDRVDDVIPTAGVTPVDDTIVDEAPREEMITDTSPTPINEVVPDKELNEDINEDFNEIVPDKELKKTHLIS